MVQAATLPVSGSEDGDPGAPATRIDPQLYAVNLRVFDSPVLEPDHEGYVGAPPPARS